MLPTRFSELCCLRDRIDRNRLRKQYCTASATVNAKSTYYLVLTIEYSLNYVYSLILPFRLFRDDRFPTGIGTRPTKGIWTSTSETDHLRISFAPSHF